MMQIWRSGCWTSQVGCWECYGYWSNSITIWGNSSQAGCDRWYCVETICAPCGVVVAWTLFDKSESPTNIFNWLDVVYLTSDLWPNYICIDEACMVLHTAISNGSWNVWKETSHFIVGSYHYINHHTSDYLVECCFAWHVQVSLGLYFNFKTELVHSGLCAMWHLGYNSIFPSARIKIRLWKINK